MKKIIFGIVALVVLGMGMMFLYVSMVDWNSHKDKVTAQFSNLTGKDVVFDGAVNFKVFPSPYLNASNVKVFDKNREANPEPLAVIKSMQVDLSLLPLLKGNFDVKKMVIVEPEMLVEILPEGKINWQSPISYDQENEIDVILDSLIIERAKLNIVSKEDNINVTLDNLNAEIIADSVFGPYRIDGTYMKDNSPEGFSVSLGRFSDSFATSLNFVINHPKSSSYLRFDGSFFLKNSAINGSLIFESAKVVDFLNSYFNYKISNDFEYPLALSMEVNTSKTKLDISNFVVKYGDSVGAGNILVPIRTKEFGYDEEEEKLRQKIEIGFNMTDLDLGPVIKALKNAASLYDVKGKEFELDLGYDVLFDLKSIKTIYKDQAIRDFSVSFDILENIISINSIGAILPGETSFTTKGKIFSLDDVFTYNFDVSMSSLDSLKMLQWLGNDIQPLNQFTYRNAELTTSILGNMHNIKLSPLNLKLDKTVVNGEVGVIRGDRYNLLVDLTVDSVNFDNYITKAPETIVAEGLEAQAKYWASKVSFLKDVDMQFRTSLGLGIYSTVPFENTKLNIKLDNGVFDVESFSISSVKNATIETKGIIKPFDEKIGFSNLTYNISTQNFYSIFDENKLPEFMKSAQNFKKIDIKGSVTGDFENITTKSLVKLENMDFAYLGNISTLDKKYKLNGKLEIKAPDFIKFVNRFNITYNPRVISMGILKLATNIEGVENNFKLNDLDLYIGNNRFRGSLGYEKTGDTPKVVADIHANRFEFERFFYNNNKNPEVIPGFTPISNERVDFIAKPHLDKTKIDYSLYPKIRLNGLFKVDTLIYNDDQISEANFNLAIDETKISLSDFQGKYLGGDIKGGFDLSLLDGNNIKGKLSFTEKPIDGYLSGNKYGIEFGVLSAEVDFDTFATSQYDFVSGISGSSKLNISKPIVKGWDIYSIEEDLKSRKDGENLTSFAQEKLQTGETVFDTFKANVLFDKGNYKFVDAGFESAPYDVSVAVDGSLDLWDAKADFGVTLLDREDKNSFSFKLSGPISSPNISVDVLKIIGAYDENLKAIEIEKQKKALEKLDKLSALMGDQYDRALPIIKDINEKISFIEARLLEVEGETIISEYASILADLNKAKIELDNVISFASEPEETFTAENVEVAKEVNDKSEKHLVDVKSRIDFIYLQDVKNLVNSKYNNLANQYKDARLNIVKYRDSFVEYPKRMAIMKKVFVINNDENVNGLKAEIEANFLKLDAKNNEGAKDYLAFQTINNASELEVYLDKIKSMQEEYDEDEIKLDESISKLLEYLEDLVSKEEVEYDKFVEEEKVKQKIEENVGSISTSTGKSVTVMRDIEEIEKLEELKEKEEIRVLDFSKDSKKSDTTINPNKAMSRDEIKAKISNENSGNILKKTDGEISGASGSISKK